MHAKVRRATGGIAFGRRGIEQHGDAREPAFGSGYGPERLGRGRYRQLECLCIRRQPRDAPRDLGTQCCIVGLGAVDEGGEAVLPDGMAGGRMRVVPQAHEHSSFPHNMSISDTHVRDREERRRHHGPVPPRRESVGGVAD